MADPHPDYLDHPAHRWQGQALKTLLPELRASAEAGDGTAKAVLPGGAWVGLRLEDGRAVVGIWRTEPGRAADWQSRFASEVLVFMRVMGILDWRREHSTLPNGGPIVTLRETVRVADFFSEASS